jgi:hypothetical protein
MNGDTSGRSADFSTGAMETKYPSDQPVAPRPFAPTSVFDQTQVLGSSNGLSSDDYGRKRLGGGAAPSKNGASSTTYDSRLWIDKNPARTIGG